MSRAAPFGEDPKNDPPAQEPASPAEIQKMKNVLDRKRYQYRRLLQNQVCAIVRFFLGGFGSQKAPKDAQECTHCATGFGDLEPRGLSPPLQIDPTPGELRPRALFEPSAPRNMVAEVEKVPSWTHWGYAQNSLSDAKLGTSGSKLTQIDSLAGSSVQKMKKKCNSQCSTDPRVAFWPSFG